MRVLIFKVNQLGDNIVFLPVVQEMRRRFPGWELAIFTSPVAEPLYAAAIPDPARRFVESTPGFNGSWRRPLDFARLWWRALAFRPDACLIADDQANAAYLLAGLSGARWRVAVRRPFIKLGALATATLPFDPSEKVAATNWRIAGTLVAAAGGEGWPTSPPPPDLSHLTDGASSAPDGPLQVAIHPGASQEYKRWFPERYAALANRLAAEAGFAVVWLGAPAGGMPGLSPAVTCVPTPRLSDLARTLAASDLFVGNNSGPMHLANSLGCPAVIICGPTTVQWDPAWYPDRTLVLRDEALPCLPCDTPNASAHMCRRLDDPLACMKFWTVDAVFERCVEWARRWRAARRQTPPAVTPC